MNEFMKKAMEEMKRADHLIFVSLKYTRTVDVLKHVIARLINTLDLAFSAILEKLKDEGKIDEVPTTPVQKANLLKEKFVDDGQVVEFCDFFLKLRKIDKASFERAREFRRHVTMTVVLPDDELIEINIDSITSDFKRTKDFLEHVKQLME